MGLELALGVLLLNLLVPSLVIRWLDAERLLHLLLATTLGWAVAFAALRAAAGPGGFRGALALHPVRVNDVVETVPAALALAVLGTLASRLEADRMAEWQQMLQQPGALIATAVAALTLAPLCEELYYRGLWQGVFERSLGRLPAVVLAALWFGAVHGMQYGFAPLSLGVIVLVGLSAGVFRIRHGSVWPAVGLHFGFNASTLLLGLWLQPLLD